VRRPGSVPGTLDRIEAARRSFLARSHGQAAVVARGPAHMGHMPNVAAAEYLDVDRSCILTYEAIVHPDKARRRWFTGGIDRLAVHAICR
jgi:hypothetical protein